jgi:hypothetical protein
MCASAIQVVQIGAVYQFTILHTELQLAQPPEPRPERRAEPYRPSSCGGFRRSSAPRTAPAATYLHSPKFPDRTSIVHPEKKSLVNQEIDHMYDARTFSGGEGGVEVDDVGAAILARRRAERPEGAAVLGRGAGHGEAQ